MNVLLGFGMTSVPYYLSFINFSTKTSHTHGFEDAAIQNDIALNELVLTENGGKIEEIEVGVTGENKTAESKSKEVIVPILIGHLT